MNIKVIRQWIAELREQGYSPNTINIRLASVRAFFNWAYAEGRIQINPVKGIRNAKRKSVHKTHRKEILTDAEMVNVLDAPSLDTPEGIRNSAILHLMAYTAVRSVEIHRANLEDLRTEGNRLVLYVHGKGRDEAAEKVIIVNQAAQQALHNWLAIRPTKGNGTLFQSLSNRSYGERISLRAIRYIVKRCFKVAGVHGDRKTTHSIRHTAITKAIENGATPIEAKEMARSMNGEVSRAQKLEFLSQYVMKIWGIMVPCLYSIWQ